ncbi:ferric-dicitrate binding protein FerR, regulates iron transport through sigma-19 [Catalinimonas alkaloidigena]|uniref:Ferric-dicitrate binding protein FerR, regulates iron transport through sigma-19 n=1 Tax=Catalinimonas alkaloidigena TaxID=1075417 RepID=A0A1G8YE93_9BACT|nr:FecR family protein [Catalinimonas alkaloidigena]SDK01168.1 ferric-dicitrate binding protein FerR, regulates iron transport through sigma-19 [Catalinimonas alkaloidigena]
MDYLQFSVHDFVTDPFFIRWVQHPDEETQAFWTAWLRRNPEKKSLLDEARQLVLAFGEEENAFSEADLTDLWQTIETRTQPARPVVSLWRRRWQPLAAAVTLLLAAAVALYYYRVEYRWVEYQTAFGEQKEIQLPDGSTVILNANSRLRMPKAWPTDAPRQVWLAGEGYFDVVHTTHHQLFQVLTDEVTVAVRGTRFNVWQRERQARVVLNSGRVELTSEQNQAPLVMHPGELVEVVRGEYSHATPVDTLPHIAWKNQQLVFQESPVQDVIAVLEDNYGFEVSVQDSTLLEKRITTRAIRNDVELLLRLLEESLDVEVQRDGKHLHFVSASSSK